MTVLDYLWRATNLSPEKIAFSDDEKEITYSELADGCKRIATAIAREIGTMREPIAVLIDRNVESICAFLGIAASRNFYVPIDMTQPVKRIKAIFDQMHPVAAIFIGNQENGLHQQLNIPILEYDELLSCDYDDALLDEIRMSAMDTDPLYAICTSGSTGIPKGVVKSHRSVMGFIPEFVRLFEIDESDIFGNQSPFDFDVSAKDIYSTLYCGASMYIIPQKCFSMPKLLVENMEYKRVTTILWAVSALCIVAGLNAFKHLVPSSLKRVMFSGEIMPIKTLKIWRSYLPNAIFVNLYGPTESTGNCLYYIVDREFEDTDRLPLGKPFPNQSIAVLDENDRPIKPGGTGELCIMGASLAIGYYRDLKRTASVFVQNPLNDCYFERMYRTGDMVTLAEDGEYYFAARRDFQVKHMGRRVELEEIETYVGAADGVARACCIYDGEKDKIIAFYSGTASKMDIINSLKLQIPKYMLPNIYIYLDEMPINKNGKIDRQKLAEQYSN